MNVILSLKPEYQSKFFFIYLNIMRGKLSQELCLGFDLYISNPNSNFCHDNVSMVQHIDNPDYDEFYKALK